MLQTLYAIKDVKNGFTGIHVGVNNSVEMRDLQTLIAKNKESLYALYPEDFELWKVGTIDTETGIIYSELVHVVNLVDLVEKDA